MRGSEQSAIDIERVFVYVYAMTSILRKSAAPDRGRAACARPRGWRGVACVRMTFT